MNKKLLLRNLKFDRKWFDRDIAPGTLKNHRGRFDYLKKQFPDTDLTDNRDLEDNIIPFVENKYEVPKNVYSTIKIIIHYYYPKQKISGRSRKPVTGT